VHSSAHRHRFFRRTAATGLVCAALGLAAFAAVHAPADVEAHEEDADVSGQGSAQPMLHAFYGGGGSSHDHAELAVQTPKAVRGYSEVPNQVLFRTDARGRPVIADNLTNIRQGDAAGDCYFLASLMAVAQASPRTIEDLVHDNADGTYTGRFYGLMSEDFWAEEHGRGHFLARVNGDLPGKRGRPVYNWVETVDGQTVSWAAIAEKLWAAVNENHYGAINGRGDSSQDDHDVQNGLFAITGIVPTERRVRSLTLKQVRHDLEHGAVVVGTAPRSGKVKGDHALAVLAVDEERGTVLLGDPEGPRPELKFKHFKNTNINQYFTVPLDGEHHEEQTAANP
jgi:hypothetical protein